VLDKKGIALLITVLFIMAITISVGVGLKYIKKASNSVNSEKHMLQSSVILNDVLKMLKNSSALEQITSADGLALFLEESSFIPFQSNGIKVLIEIGSARAKINPNTLSDQALLDIFKSFLISKRVNPQYAYMLSDVMGGVKEDMSYNTDIFTQKPSLFRDYIVSQEHLLEINDAYKKKYHDNSLKNIDMQELFYVSKDKNTTIDLNHATPLAWEFMIGCDENRANLLSENGGINDSLENLLLSDEEEKALQKFQTSFYEPYIEVKLEIIQKDVSVNIRFEYNIKSKKGSNFVFEV